jgi:hypothetical protein
MSDEESTSLKIGGFNISRWAMVVAVPVLSSLSGAVYFGYDALSRFEAVESSVEPLLDLDSRMQAVEQALEDNDVRGLAARLSTLSTQMDTILENQRQLLDMRSVVERSDQRTAGIDEIIRTLNQEVEDIWNAYDSLVENPIR